jgi:hypothetical protein
VDIDIPDAFAMKDMALDELQDLVAVGHYGGREILQEFEDRLAVTQTAASDLAHHERVHHDGRALKQVDEPRIAAAKVVDPHGRVDQNQAGFSVRLRGAAFNARCVPPNRARRFALSLSMSAFNPSLKMAVRSIGPANLVAFASKSSSMLTVVRMILLSPVGTNIASFDASSDVACDIAPATKPASSAALCRTMALEEARSPTRRDGQHHDAEKLPVAVASRWPSSASELSHEFVHC